MPTVFSAFGVSCFFSVFFAPCLRIRTGHIAFNGLLTLVSLLSMRFAREPPYHATCVAMCRCLAWYAVR